MRRALGGPAEALERVAAHFDALFAGLPSTLKVWMSHGDRVTDLGAEFEVLARTAREAVDALRAGGAAVGLLKVRLFRPLPVQALRAALAGVPDVLVLDRNYSPGAGGVLHQELKSLLYGLRGAPRVHGYLAGVGGLNVPPAKIAELVRRAAAESEPRAEATWA